MTSPVLFISETFKDVFGLTAPSWQPWEVITKATFGEPLTADELTLFQALANHRPLPDQRVAELWVIAGRRGGKSRIAALLALYISVFIDHRPRLAPGELGYVLVLSPTVDQSQVITEYIKGFAAASEILGQQIESIRGQEIRLRNRIVIRVQPANFRTIRGRTLVAAILDEVAFMRDETSANPDQEIYRAVQPALATTGGLIIGISSPYRKVGLLHQKWRDNYGKPSAVLVIKAPTLQLNSTIDKATIDRAYTDDAQAARAEWGAQFRTDLQALLDEKVIDDAIDHYRPKEIPPDPNTPYFAFVDASAGRHDAFAICIGSKQPAGFRADVVRYYRPPFDPDTTAKECAALAKEYNCHRITGDNFAGDWVANAFRKTGMTYTKSDKPKSKLYLEMLPHFNRGAISIPNDERLIRELRLLERRTTVSGQDRVDHPQGAGASDDLANVLAGAAYLAMIKAERPKGEAQCGVYTLCDPPQPPQSHAGYTLPTPIYGPNGAVTYVDNATTNAAETTISTRSRQ
jgi:hypothetical protein